MSGFVVWRGALPRRDGEVHRIVLIPTTGKPAIVVAERLTIDAAGGEAWTRTAEALKGDVMEQAINDLVAALQQQAQAAQQQQQQQQQQQRQEKKR